MASAIVLVGLVVEPGFSSSSFEMKAVSTRIDGMSGAFRTAKPACSTCGFVQVADTIRVRRAPPCRA